MDFDFEEDYERELDPEPLDDPAVIRATQELRVFFEEHPQEVYYETQLCIFFEHKFFHWVTSRALKGMRQGGEIGSELHKSPPACDPPVLLSSSESLLEAQSCRN